MPKGLDYIINLKDGDFGGAKKAKSEVEGLDTAVQSTHEHARGLGAMLGEVGGVLAGVFAVEKIFEFGKDSQAVFKQTQMASAQIAAGLKSTNGAVGESMDQLIEQAEKLEHTTLFTQAQTEQAEAIELTFTNIRGAIFDQALPAIQNLATRMGGDGPADLKGASVQVGKALQDPITGIVALHRVGVEFDDAQKAQIKTLVQHGEIQKAQGVILKELNKEFGGSAAAARAVLGPMGDLDQETDDLKKSMGKLITDGLKVIVPGLVELVHGVQSATKWIGENKDLLISVGIVVGSAAAAYGIYELTILALEAPMAIMTAAQWALNVAMDANPVGLIVTGIGALIGGLILAYKKSETFRAILAGIGEVAKSIMPIFKGLGEIIWGALTFDPAMIKKGFEDSVNGVKDIIAKGGVSGVFMKGAVHSLVESKKADAEEKKKADELKKGTASDLVGKHGKADPYSISTGKHSKGDGSDSASLSGGRSVRNVHVVINKLVETLSFSNTSINGTSKADIKRQLTELLVGVVHDSELALGSQ